MTSHAEFSVTPRAIERLGYRIAASRAVPRSITFETKWLSPSGAARIVGAAGAHGDQHRHGRNGPRFLRQHDRPIRERGASRRETLKSGAHCAPRCRPSA